MNTSGGACEWCCEIQATGDAKSGSLEGCKWEEQEAKKAFDRANKFVKDEKYERAISLLEKAERLFSGFKGLAELMAVAEVCLAATWEQCTCQARPQNKTPDWFRILKVDEKADTNAIKKRYRQLALLLHPDKNKHVKAEAAFKLVSEAYACLSDKYKRNLFTLGRSKTRCKRCVLTSRMQSPTPSFGYYEHQQKVSAQQKPQAAVNMSKQSSECKSDAEKLHMFRERARARVSSLEQAWEARNAKWSLREKSKAERTSDACRDQRTDKVDCFSDLRDKLDQMEKESRHVTRDSYNWRAPSRPSHTPGPGCDRTFSNLKDTGKQRRPHKGKPSVSQSLDDLLNMLRAENSAYSRRDYSDSRGEHRNGAKEGNLSARSPEGNVDPGSTSFADRYDLNNRECPSSSKPAEVDLRSQAIDKFLSDILGSVDLVSRKQGSGECEAPASTGYEASQTNDRSSNSAKFTASAPQCKHGSFSAQAPVRDSRKPCAASDGREGATGIANSGVDWSRSYDQASEEEGHVCTCNLPLADPDPVTSKPGRLDHGLSNSMCTPDAGIEDLLQTRTGDSKSRAVAHNRNELAKPIGVSQVGELSSATGLIKESLNVQAPQAVEAESANRSAETLFSFGIGCKLTAKDLPCHADKSWSTGFRTGRATVPFESVEVRFSKLGDNPADAVVEMGVQHKVSSTWGSVAAAYFPTRTADPPSVQTSVQLSEPGFLRAPDLQKASTVIPRTSDVTCSPEIDHPSTIAEKNASRFQESGSSKFVEKILRVLPERNERVQDQDPRDKGDKRQSGSDSWSFQNLDNEQTLMREHKEKSDQLLKTLERLREEARSVAATLDNLRRSVGTEADVVSGSFFANSCHPPVQSLVA